MAKAAHNAIGGPPTLNFEHRAGAGRVRFVGSLRDDPSSTSCALASQRSASWRSWVNGVTRTRASRPSCSATPSNAARRSVSGLSSMGPKSFVARQSNKIMQLDELKSKTA